MTASITLNVTLFALAISCAAAANAAALPLCAGRVEIAGGHLLRVEKNGAIILTDGRALHLEGIRLPDGALDRAPQTYADAALATLKQLAGSAPLSLTSIPPKEDRYDRIRVQAFVGDRWVQAVLLNKGLARVAIAPDRTECAAELFAVEAQARAERRGLWAEPAYAVRHPSSVGPDIGTFQIVEGRVLNANVRKGRAYLNFSANWRTGFSVVIDPEDMPNFRASGVDPRSYSGQTIRVRGWVQWHYGLAIEVANPQGIEVVP